MKWYKVISIMENALNYSKLHDIKGEIESIISSKSLQELCAEISFGKEVFEVGADKVIAVQINDRLWPT